jgi:hypothetical protein
VLSPKDQQNWFAARHLFDIVVIYDEDSRVNSYTGGPTIDIHQVRLRNLTVAIFDYATYSKPLKRVPMLLVGGIQAWCRLGQATPLRAMEWPRSRPPMRLETPEPRPARGSSPRVDTDMSDMSIVSNGVDDLDLDAECEWLESLHSEKYLLRD